MPAYEAPPVEGNHVVIDLREIRLNTPRFYTFQDGSRRVNFFVLKTEDSVEAYLDACMRCYPHKKGFRVDGFFLVCRYCGTRYPLDKLKTGLGTCYPIPLKVEQKGNILLISINSLKKAERYF